MSKKLSPRSKALARDPFPIICPAGIKTVPDKINDLLVSYPMQEAAGNILDAEKQNQQPPFNRVYSLLMQDQVPAILEGDFQKSRFSLFKEKFYEDLYYKKCPLAKCCTPDWFVDPKGPDFTFGKPSLREEPLYEIVLPKKSSEDVWKEYSDGHDMYILSHNDYYPSEQINRKYKPKFFRDNVFGHKNNIDFAGNKMKKIFQDLKGCPHREQFINMTQKEYFDRTKFTVGKPVKKQGLNFEVKNENELVFGHPRYKDKYGVKELFDEESSFCPEEETFYQAFSYLRNLRIKIFRMIFLYPNDLASWYVSADVNKTNFLPWEKIFSIARNGGLIMDKDKIKYISKYFNIVSEDGNEVKYRDFVDLLRIRTELPALRKIHDHANVSYSTTYREFTKDRENMDVGKCAIPAAGNLRTSMPKKVDIKSSIVHLSNETSVKDLICPSLPQYFGLSHRDFLSPMTMDEIKAIFNGAGFDLTNFDEIWEAGRKSIPCPDGYCTVEGFRSQTNEIKHFNKEHLPEYLE